MRGKTSANDEVKQDMERGPEEVIVEQDKAQGNKEEISTEAGSSSQKQQNQTIWFGKPEHPISLGLGQRDTSRTTALGAAPAPCLCPLGLTPS
jgi:hypothetical protein